MKEGVGYQWFRYWKDAIFPVFCFGCEKEGRWLCSDCEKRVIRNGVWCCPVCHKATDYGGCCVSCRSQSTLDSHVAMTVYYEDGIIGELIPHLKYRNVREIIDLFHRWNRVFLEHYRDVFRDIDVIVPVPLHKRREVERGFNQANIIAAGVSVVLGIPVVCHLARVRSTPHQATLQRAERFRNIHEAFQFVGDTVPRRVLLVDDVFTTGATMQECARVLKHAGVDSVRGFSLARG